jgi:hypothetical protein
MFVTQIALLNKRVTCQHGTAPFVALTEEEIVVPSGGPILTFGRNAVEFQCKKGGGVFGHCADSQHTPATQVYAYQVNTAIVRLGCKAFSRDLGLSSLGKNRVQGNARVIQAR